MLKILYNSRHEQGKEGKDLGLTHHLMRIDMILNHVLYLTYEIPATDLRPFVPRSLSLATAGKNRAFVSIVVLQCRNVHASWLPFPRFNYTQMNLRTYVKDPATGEQAVYFLRSAVTSTLVSIMTRTIGIPWEQGVLDLKVFPRTGENTLSYDLTGNWQGDIRVHAEALAPLPDAMAPFVTTAQAIRFLLLPMTGFFGKDRVKGFHITHPALQPQALKLREIKIPFFSNMPLLKETDWNDPHSVLYVPEATFRIFLPASTVR
ncbi:MAG: DUF2071 domain-containing protein [Syntrophales bacterium]|jgi:hypothetical protein|nr:DUF2071 domain-containing protein [Syntrophales bacterium]